MILYHGSRKVFNKFKHEFWETGEGAGQDVFGFWFVDNPQGAGNHADNYVRSEKGEPYVYVCEIPEDAPTLKRGVPVREQAHHEHWNTHLPLSLSVHDQEADWFENLFSSRAYNAERYSDRQKLIALCDAGFVAVHDFELCHTDNYLHGRSTIIMDVEMINILDRVHTHSEQYKQMKKEFWERRYQ